MKNWWKKWTKFYHLSLSEKWAFFQALFLLFFFKLLLILLPFTTFRRTYAILTFSKNKKIYAEDFINKKVKAVERASSLLPNIYTCLPKALATKYLLRQQPDFRLQIVVSSNPNAAFEAHAWVINSNKIIIGDIPNFNYITLWQWN